MIRTASVVNPASHEPQSQGSALQNYQPVRRLQDVFQPGFTIGGPLLQSKDRVFLLRGFSPVSTTILSRHVNFNAAGLSQWQQRLPRPRYAALQPEHRRPTTPLAAWTSRATKKIRLFVPGCTSIPVARASISFARRSSGTGYLNVGIASRCRSYRPQPRLIRSELNLNFGADITINHKMVATTRFGYFFENYHDFGCPTTGP